MRNSVFEGVSYQKQPNRAPDAKSPKGPSWLVVVLIAMMTFAIGYRLEVPDSSVANDANSQLSEDIDFSEIEDVYDTLRQNFDGVLDAEALEEGLKQGLVDAAGDPYTVYLDKDAAEAFNTSLNGEFVGIGAELGNENDRLIIVAPISGFPAEKAGLRAGDIIETIDGEDATSLSIEEAVLKIRGDKDTEVTLGIVRNNEFQEITIVRDNIVVPSVEYEVLEGNIGYLKLTRFAEDTTKLARQFAQDAADNGVEKIILDLRNNSGGILQSAIDVSGIWLNEKVAVKQRSANGQEKDFRTDNRAILEGVKTIVLINEGSASASEIVAGALADHNAAELVGTKSFGKGSVQALEDLDEGGVLKVTIARWFTPNGQNIDGAGIEPNHQVGLTEADYDSDRDPQLDKARELL